MTNEFLEVNSKKTWLEMEHITNIVFLFAGNRVAANLPVLNGCEIPLWEREGKLMWSEPDTLDTLFLARRGRQMHSQKTS